MSLAVWTLWFSTAVAFGIHVAVSCQSSWLTSQAQQALYHLICNIPSGQHPCCKLTSVFGDAAHADVLSVFVQLAETGSLDVCLCMRPSIR